MKVLIVEDETIVALELKLLVEEAGHEAIGPAATSNVARALVEVTRPDVALVDIELRDGPTGIQLARDLQTQRKIPCFFVTSSISEARANEDAALGVLSKPFAPDDVVAVLDAMPRIMRGGGVSSCKSLAGDLMAPGQVSLYAVRETADSLGSRLLSYTVALPALQAKASTPRPRCRTVYPSTLAK